MARRIPEARRRFESFVALLLDHMRHERAEFLPIYARLPQPVGGSVDLIEAEHRKMLWHIRRIRRALKRPRWTAAHALKLLDDQWLFVQLLDHHDRREARFLYPALDANRSASIDPSSVRGRTSRIRSR